MTLITKVEMKEYLRRPAGETAEDNLFDRMLASAKALIERHLGVPITAATRTWSDRGENRLVDRCIPSLLLPRPCASVGLVVVDSLGRTLAAAEYDTIELTEFGMLYAARGYSFTDPPYQGTGTIGLSAHPDYGSQLEPIVNEALQDTVAEWYQNRRPGAGGESDPGVSVTNLPDELPPRVVALLKGITRIIA